MSGRQETLAGAAPPTRETALSQACLSCKGWGHSETQILSQITIVLNFENPPAASDPPAGYDKFSLRITRAQRTGGAQGSCCSCHEVRLRNDVVFAEGVWVGRRSVCTRGEGCRWPRLPHVGARCRNLRECAERIARLGVSCEIIFVVK